MKYRAEIDGLRAVAVLPVVAFHAGLSVLSGGFAGVDVFFVISGFLITSIIVEEAEAGRFSIGRFYERRARRILPALFLVMLLTLPAAWAVMVPYQLEDFAQSIIATLLFVSNVLFWFEADYFGVEAATKPLLHTWSLAVEEQFYVVFPILLAILYRIGRGTVVPVLALGLIASLALALIFNRSNPTAAFFLIQFRAWELMIGALAAIWMRNAPPAPNPLLAGAGLLAIVISFFLITEESPWPGPLTLLPVLGTAAILVFARADGGVGRLLAAEPVRFVGLISYSLYLWHLPPLALLHILYFGAPPLWAILAAVALSFVGAWASWRFVERPFRQPGRVRLAPFAAVMVAALAPLALFGVAGHQTSGFQAYMTARVPADFAAQVIDRQAEVAAREAMWGPIIAEASKPFEPDTRRKVLILGDSLSGDLMVTTGGHGAAFAGSQFRRMRLDDRCMGAMLAALETGAAPKGAERCPREVRRLLEAGLIGAADEIVLATNWQPETFEDGIALAQALLGEGPDVAILGVGAFNDMASLSMRLHAVEEPLERFFWRNIREKFLPLNARFADVAAATERLRYLDKLALYCDAAAETCDMLGPDGKPILFDNAHVTTTGAGIVSGRIVREGWFE